MAKCQCRTPEPDGTIKHSGKLVTFSTREVDTRTNKFTVIVCWHHRKFYSGWKKSVELSATNERVKV